MTEYLFARLEDVDASSAIAAAAAAAASAAAALASETAAELAETNAETAETNAETAETNAELAEVNAEAAQAAAEDAADEAEDFRDAAEDWAIRPEDDPVPVASGGDGSTTFSALHWAFKAEEFASAIDPSLLVAEADYNAHTILAATADNTPLPLTVGEQTLVGRITAGNIAALTPSEVRTMLGLDTNDAVVFGSLAVDDEAYDATGWNADLTVPTKNAVRDFIETLIGTTLPATYQPLDADLTSIAALATAAYGRSLLTLANATALAAEVDSFFLTPTEGNAAYQPLDAGLTDIAGLATTDSNIIVGSGSNWVAESGATARTSLGLGTANSPQFTDLTLTNDLLLAAGSIVNFDSGDVLITHSSGGLSFSGASVIGYQFDALIATPLAAISFLSMAEQSTPAAPAANSLYIYSKDDSSTTRLAFIDSASLESYILTNKLGGVLASAFGLAATSVDDGTKTSGTFTPTFAAGNFRRYINGGAHTLAPPTGEGTMVIQITNDGSAGTITTSGFTKKTGDAFTTTSGHDFLCNIQVVNAFSHLHVTALQ